MDGNAWVGHSQAALRLDLSTVAASLSSRDSFREVKSLNLNRFVFQKDAFGFGRFFWGMKLQPSPVRNSSRSGSDCDVANLVE
jgi:hypothetical protein